MARRGGSGGGAVFGIGYCLVLVLVLVYSRICMSARSDKETRQRFYGNLVNTTEEDSGDGSIAKMFDRVLEKEFPDNEQSSGSASFAFLNFSFLFFFLMLNFMICAVILVDFFIKI